MPFDLHSVVEVSDESVTRSYGGRCYHKHVSNVRPKHRREQYAHENQGPAHRGRPRLFLVTLGILVADNLTDLLPSKGADKPRRYEE